MYLDCVLERNINIEKIIPRVPSSARADSGDSPEHIRLTSFRRLSGTHKAHFVQKTLRNINIDNEK